MRVKVFYGPCVFLIFLFFCRRITIHLILDFAIYGMHVKMARVTLKCRPRMCNFQSKRKEKKE